MADDHHGPRKMGVYDGAGTTRSQSKSFLTILAVVVLVLLLVYWAV